MPGKKKKTQLKPVARGFATTSVPSKKAVAETDISSNVQGSEQLENTDENRIERHSNEPQTGSLLAEQEILQTIADKWQDKTEREINRVLKAGETEFVTTRLDIDFRA
jgi:ATP-dependent RNA helicase DHX29